MADQLLKVRENVQTLNEMKKVSIEFKNDRDSKYNMRTVKYELEKKGHKVEISGNMLTVTAKRGSDIGREARDVRNFYTGVKRIKALESVEEETLDEGRMKELAMKIAQVYSNMKKDKNMRSFADKFRKDVAKSLDIRKSLEKVLPDYVAGKDITNIMSKHVPGHKEEGLDEAKYQVNYAKNNKLYSQTINARNEDDAEEKAIKKFKITDDDIRSVVKEETLDEGRMKELAMKIAQVYSNMKKDKNMRSFADKFRKDVAKSLDIRKSLEKVLPDYVAGKDITNIMSKHVPGHKEEGLDEAKYQVNYAKNNKLYSQTINARNEDDAEEKAIKKFKITDDDIRSVVKEAKLIDKPTGEVLKTGSKKEMETERKRNRDELQVQEWFKSKNIDVKVRQLDESTQVYVPLGRRIPNEIREELITTQYGKMPEDVKNVKDINYGNFVENSITMNNDFWTKVLHGTKGE